MLRSGVFCAVVCQTVYLVWVEEQVFDVVAVVVGEVGVAHWLVIQRPVG